MPLVVDASNHMLNPEESLFALFDNLGLRYKVEVHEPTFTVAESRDIKSQMSGMATKNLFLKDKRGDFALISAAADTVIRLNKLHPHLGMARLSFGAPEWMDKLLGVTPGSVTAFALMNDENKQVRFVLDKKLDEASNLCFHPLRNDMTVVIDRTSFQTFLEAIDRKAEIFDFQSH